MIKFIKLLLIYTWPFGLLLTFRHPSILFPLYLMDGIVILVGLLVLLKQYVRIVKSPIFKPYLIFLLTITISSLIHQNLSPHLLRFIFYPLLIFFFDFYQDNNDTKHFILSAFISLVLGITQYLILPDVRFLKNLGFDDHYYRLIGTVFDPNYQGIIYVVFLFVFLSRQKYLISSLLLIPIALTFSRASYVSLVVGLLFYIIATKRKILLLLLILLFGILVIVPKPFGEGVNLLRTYSINSRIDSWQTGIEIFSKYPLFGNGFITSKVDNSYILVFAQTGIIGALAFFTFLKKIYFKTNLSNRPALVAILVHALFNNTLFFIWVYSLIFILASVQFKEYKKP